jgi:hypothetical protein
MNWYQLQLGVNIVQLQGWHVARLAAEMGATGLTPRGPQCELFHASFLLAPRQLVLVRKHSVSVTIYKKPKISDYYKIFIFKCSE